MAEWLSIIGIGEDGASGLPDASRQALAAANVVFGGPRHLAMIEHPDKRPWPVPFALAPVLALRGQRVAVLASGDPFWFGAGGSLARELAPGEWRALPAPSVFALVAARKGWRLEEVSCHGLHAAPLSRLRPGLAPGARLIVTLRDGKAPAALAAYLVETGFSASLVTFFTHLGGPEERVIATTAGDFDGAVTEDLVVAALEIRGVGRAATLATGRADDLFEHDGQITKRPIRALALSALAPRAGELLWDIGTGSGSVAIEWLLSHPAMRAIGVEADASRAGRARGNAMRLGTDRLEIREGRALDVLPALPRPDAVFIGGGADDNLLNALWACLPQGVRVVAHGVTLETEALLAAWHGARGGQLLRFELAEAVPLGRRRGWKSSYPVVQWCVTR
ncbi:precorrin-6y C5,15-methyltransferase (decarboxylating) subunit CbiE [Rhodobacter sp. 24-YEA-8]|uniref:precorrin-6y C5,15-methyltransferase (decarboxylating) subunit CbiE n=1 Tax=Rhodobacter sp. 24-YEA-8 TaxID=1884310 RepID=UPI000894FE15|nr:precorrin-6y C5,15-methyltransferase (decarboxylating) subunit CbiE [Rhodobacter sp. 24-YEA-8]SEC59178.1 precorrin-6Y C5,15-methyltransferase (decarboxylating) [Rhodobacter sp. 24-YEA-8]